MVSRFDNRSAQFAVAAFGSVIALLGLAGLAASSASLIYLLIGAFTIGRGLRASSVVVDGSAVTTRSILRTRRYPLAELTGVDVAIGRTGFAGSGREYLILHRADGGAVKFKELNCPPPKPPATTSVVRNAALCIKERL